MAPEKHVPSLLLSQSLMRKSVAEETSSSVYKRLPTMLITSQRNVIVAVLAVALIGFDVKLLQYPLIIAVTIMAYCWYSGADKTDAVEVISPRSATRISLGTSPLKLLLQQKLIKLPAFQKTLSPLPPHQQLPHPIPKVPNLLRSSSQSLSSSRQRYRAAKPSLSCLRSKKSLSSLEFFHNEKRAASLLPLNQSAYQVLQQIHPGTNIDNRAKKLLVAMLQWTSIASLTCHCIRCNC